eukprot:4720796-Lingulodinium_polyedra.AAC.1
MAQLRWLQPKVLQPDAQRGITEGALVALQAEVWEEAAPRVAPCGRVGRRQNAVQPGSGRGLNRHDAVVLDARL